MWVLDDGVKQLGLTEKFTGIGLVSPPDVGTPAIEADDYSIPRGDGVVMGEDFYGAQTVSFDLALRPEGARSVASFLAELRQFWRDPAHRSTGGHVIRLRSPEGRVAYGRPRRFSPDREHEKFDHITVVADFECVSDLWFGERRSAGLTLVPPLGRGLVEPLVEPLTIQGAAVVASGFEVAGELPTYPVITFHGPITNPSLWTPGWELKLRVDLAYDEQVTVDTRPWIRQVSRNGLPAGGLVMPSSSWLEDITLEPGAHTAQLRGSDPTGTARVDLWWEEAYSSF